MASAKSLYPNQSSLNGRLVAKTSLPLKTAGTDHGNQGKHNSHTQPGKIKPNGTPAQMRKIQSLTTISPLEKVGGAALGQKGGATNASRVLANMYPSSGKVDTSRKL